MISIVINYSTEQIKDNKMEAQKDKLLYFDGRARAEAIRMLYAVAEKEFEDVRVMGESWTAAKPGNCQAFL